MACGKAHGSRTYHIDIPATDGRKRRQVTQGGFPTRKAAEAALAEFLGHAECGEVVAAGRRRTGDYLDEWLVGVRPTPAVSAWTNHRSLLDLYVRARIGGVQLPALSASPGLGVAR
jgi:hypothetical protein